MADNVKVWIDDVQIPSQSITWDNGNIISNSLAKPWARLEFTVAQFAVSMNMTEGELCMYIYKLLERGIVVDIIKAREMYRIVTEAAYEATNGEN